MLGRSSDHVLVGDRIVHFSELTVQAVKATVHPIELKLSANLVAEMKKVHSSESS